MHVMIYVVRVEVLVMQNLLDEVLHGPSTLLLQSYTFSHAPVLNFHSGTGREHSGFVDVQGADLTGKQMLRHNVAPRSSDSSVYTVVYELVYTNICTMIYALIYTNRYTMKYFHGCISMHIMIP